MKKIIFVMIAACYASQIVGCATSSFCDPQSPSTLMSTGNPLNMAAGAAQFGLCGAYNVTKVVVGSKPEEAKPVEATQTAEAAPAKPAGQIPASSLSPEHLAALKAQAQAAYGKR